MNHLVDDRECSHRTPTAGIERRKREWACGPTLSVFRSAQSARMTGPLPLWLLLRSSAGRASATFRARSKANPARAIVPSSNNQEATRGGRTTHPSINLRDVDADQETVDRVT